MRPSCTFATCLLLRSLESFIVRLFASSSWDQSSFDVTCSVFTPCSKCSRRDFRYINWLLLNSSWTLQSTSFVEKCMWAANWSTGPEGSSDNRLTTSNKGCLVDHIWSLLITLFVGCCSGQVGSGDALVINRRGWETPGRTGTQRTRAARQTSVSLSLSLSLS